MANLNNRKYLGCDISKEYIQISKKRVQVNAQTKLI